MIFINIYSGIELINYKLIYKINKFEMNINIVDISFSLIIIYLKVFLGSDKRNY